ncbi:hypothetical protein FC233_07545 [Escherichia coli]|nr:hypothetical protein [Escherichia coli]
MIAITGATGQLGHYVIESLMKTVPASQIVAIVRNPAKAQALTAQGITVRQADYGDEAALTSALQGVEKLLLISSSEVGQRAPQHRNVINAAKAAGVKFIAYTSLLHADKSPLGLADEHIETEKMLADSGIVYTLLRNGWYSENYLASAPAALEHGVFIGAAGDGKIASATRADYAAAAARVISEAGHEGKVYELAGDSAWTLTQLAAELTKQSGKQVTYQNLSEADFAAALVCIGIGLACVNIAELNHGLPDFDWARYTSGIVLALVSVVCWAWYALRNARWLRENPDKHPMMWATAQALVTLPVSLIGYLVACYWLNTQTPDFSLPFGPRPLLFISLMIAIAVLCSWVGALCWNVASQRLPTVILGPLIVFETLAGLLYTFLLRQQMPPLMTLSGIALLVVGVVIAVRAKPEKPLIEPVSES